MSSRGLFCQDLSTKGVTALRCCHTMNTYFKIAAPQHLFSFLPAKWEHVPLSNHLDPAELLAVVITADSDHEYELAYALRDQSGLDFPIIRLLGTENPTTVRQQIAGQAQTYYEQVIPPFLRDLVNFADRRPLSFTTPGHHNGLYYSKHPAGSLFNRFFGENMLYADTSDTVPELGDMMTHAGSPLVAEQAAAKAYQADKVYFVTNGTTTSNSVCASAVLNPGDLVLFDRNNHKSLYNSALMIQGARPIYVNTARNPLGMIGAMDGNELDEQALRRRIAQVDPEKAHAKRPFRMAIIQAETYDGILTNPEWILEKIGHLCDYILFDCAWAGYEQYLPLLQRFSPLQHEYGPDDPGILVTQSIHKQQGGMTQVSQILKKDHHLRGQKRYVDHIHFNNAYLKFVTSSYSYPLYASLVTNAALAQAKANYKWWQELLVHTINFRKRLLKESKLFRPFVPPTVAGKKWVDIPTSELCTNDRYWQIAPQDNWHGFANNATDEAIVDPVKITLALPGVDLRHHQYETTGIPGAIVRAYLLEHDIIPGKADLNSLLFLPSPGDGPEEFATLFDALMTFERLYLADAPLEQVLGQVYRAHQHRYHGYTIQQLCNEMHNYYRANDTFTLQKELFANPHLDDYPLTPYQADKRFMRNDSEMCPLEEIQGRIALEGALPYPPGVFVVAPGERWTATSQQYFLTLLGAIERFPGFTPEIQGVHYHQDSDGKLHVFGAVLPTN